MPKEPKFLPTTPHTNLLYWTIEGNDHWFFLLKEFEELKVGLKVVEDGVEAHWTLEPPQELPKLLGLSFSDVYSSVTKLSGSHFIQAPKKLVTTASLIVKIVGNGIRCIKVPWRDDSTSVTF